MREVLPLILAVETAASGIDAPATQAAVHELSDACNLAGSVPDEVVKHLLTACADPKLSASELPAHMLMLFEFSAQYLNTMQKDQIRTFLRRNGKLFKDTFTQHVIAELTHGQYLTN